NLNEIQNEINLVDLKQNESVDFANKIRQKIQKLSILQEQFVNENNRLEDLKNHIIQHTATFNWTDFNADDFEDFQQKKHASFDLTKQIDSKNKFISEQR